MGGGWSKNKGGGRGAGEKTKDQAATPTSAGATPTTPAITDTEGIPTGATESPQPCESQSAGAMGDFVEAVVAKASEFGDNE